MKMTSAQAAKILRQLNEELKALQLRENNASSFLASVGEDPESVRPAYDYDKMQEQQAELESKIRRLKHAVNVFNSTQVIPEFGFTIDEMLVYLPQLTKRCTKLSAMKDALPKMREEQAYARVKSVIDYRYANYDIECVNEDWQKLSEELSRAQNALDLINNTAEFDFEF